MVNPSRQRQAIRQLSWQRAAVYHIGPTWVRTEAVTKEGDPAARAAKRCALRRWKKALVSASKRGPAAERVRASRDLAAVEEHLARLQTSEWRPIGPSCIYPEPTGREEDSYNPFDAPGVVSDLARIHVAWAERLSQPAAALRTGAAFSALERDPVGRAVLAFVKDYGLLGQSTLGASPHVLLANGRRYVTDGDDLLWFLDHASNVHLALKLIDALSRVDTNRLKALLEPLAQRQEHLGWLAQAAWGKGPEAERAKAALQAELKAEQRVTMTVDGQRVGLPDQRPLSIPTAAPPWRTEVPIDIIDIRKFLREAGEVTTATQVLAALITPNLIGVPRAIDPVSGVAVFRFTALVQAVYWLIADRMDSRSLRHCQECGGLFLADDERERYCPPPPGVRQSRCRRRLHERERRARQRNFASST